MKPPKMSDGKLTEAVAQGGIPKGYSAILVAPDGEVIVAIPENATNEDVSTGAILAVAIALTYSDPDHAADLVRAVFADEDGEVKMDQTDLEMMCQGGMVH